MPKKQDASISRRNPDYFAAHDGIVATRAIFINRRRPKPFKRFHEAKLQHADGKVITMGFRQCRFDGTQTECRLLKELFSAACPFLPTGMPIHSIHHALHLRPILASRRESRKDRKQGSLRDEMAEQLQHVNLHGDPVHVYFSFTHSAPFRRHAVGTGAESHPPRPAKDAGSYPAMNEHSRVPQNATPSPQKYLLVFQHMYPWMGTLGAPKLLKTEGR